MTPLRDPWAPQPQAAHCADRDRDRPRRRDDQRDVRPHRLDRPGVRPDLHRHPQGLERSHLRQVGLRPQRQDRRHRTRRSTSRCCRRCGSSRRRRGRGQRRLGRDAAHRRRREGGRVRRRAEPRVLDRERRLGLQPADAGRGRVARSERGRRRQGDRRQGGLRGRRDDRRPGRKGPSSGCASPGSSSSAPASRSAARRSPASTSRPRSACSRRSGSWTRSPSPPSRTSTDQELVAEIEAILPPDAQVLTGSEQAQSDAADTNEFISFLRTFLLAFGGIALFVGSFVIANSLSITIAQRTREFATLRTIGATNRQVLGSVIVEALVVGSSRRSSASSSGSCSRRGSSSCSTPSASRFRTPGSCSSRARSSSR